MRLREFPLTSFSDEELRRLWSAYDAELEWELPGARASRRELVDAGLALLRDRDVAPFFALLRAERPHKLAEIDALATEATEPSQRSAPRRRQTRWYPYPRVGSTRFVGRTRELERLHAMLSTERMVGVTAQIRGLGGIGKSLLAVEYANRFSEAWLGGVFWVEADPAWATPARTADERTARRHTMLAEFAASVDVRPVPGDIAATAGAVEHARAQRCGPRQLWIVDDLPPGADQALVAALMPACPDGALLVTTRWMAIDTLPHRLDLEVLAQEDALALITGRRPPADASEAAEAVLLAATVGHQPLALDVLGALVRDEISSTPLRRLARASGGVR